MINTFFKPDQIGFVFVYGFIDKYEATIGCDYFYWLEGVDTWKLYRRQNGITALFHTIYKYTMMDADVIIRKLKDVYLGEEVAIYAESSYRQYKIAQFLKSS